MKRIITFLTVLILFGASGILRAQNTGGQKSKFIRPIGITPVQDAYGATLNFGVIVPNKTQGGVLYIGRDGSWLSPGAPGVLSGGATVLNFADDRPKAHAADWNVTGEPNYLYQVTTSNPNDPFAFGWITNHGHDMGTGLRLCGRYGRRRKRIRKKSGSRRGRTPIHPMGFHSRCER